MSQQSFSTRSLPVQKVSMKLNSSSNIDLFIKRGIKFCSRLSIPNKAPTYRHQFRKLLSNLKLVTCLRGHFSTEYMKQAVEKLTFLPRLIKRRPHITVDLPLSYFKVIPEMSSLAIEKQQSSYKKLKYYKKIKTLCLTIVPDDLQKIRKLRLKSDNVYLKLKLSQASSLMAVASEPLFLKKVNENTSIHIILDLESYLQSDNFLMRGEREGCIDEMFDLKEPLRKIISEKNLTAKIASITVCNSFFETFQQCYSIKEFADHFPCLQHLTICLNLDDDNHYNLKELSLPHSITNLAVKFQISIQSYSPTFQSLKLLLTEICNLPNLTNLSVDLNSNIYLLSFFLLFASTLSNCQSLKALKVYAEEYYTQITIFELNPLKRSLKEAFPLSNLFENIFKLPNIEKVDIKVPVVNEKDLTNLGKINLTRLKRLRIIIKDQRGFKNEELRCLTRFLSKNTGLESLEMNISSNEINDIGIKNFCYQISRMNHLKKLLLSLISDNITQSTIIEIAKTIRNHPSLRKLKFHFRTYSVVAVDPTPLMELINHSNRLEYLRVTSPNFLIESR